MRTQHIQDLEYRKFDETTGADNEVNIRCQWYEHTNRT